MWMYCNFQHAQLLLPRFHLIFARWFWLKKDQNKYFGRSHLLRRYRRRRCRRRRSGVVVSNTIGDLEGDVRSVTRSILRHNVERHFVVRRKNEFLRIFGVGLWRHECDAAVAVSYRHEAGRHWCRAKADVQVLFTWIEIAGKTPLILLILMIIIGK